MKPVKPGERFPPVSHTPSQLKAPEYFIRVPQGAAAMSVVENHFPKCKIQPCVDGGKNRGGIIFNWRRLTPFSFDDGDLIQDLYFTSRDDLGKYSFAGHDAIADRVKDITAIMTDLADL